MLFAPFDLLPRVETALPPFPALLTERESMVATDASLFRPAFCRAASRKANMAVSQVPSSRHRRRYPYTVFHGGKSWGSIQHWQTLQSWLSVMSLKVSTNQPARINDTRELQKSSKSRSPIPTLKTGQWAILRPPRKIENIPSMSDVFKNGRTHIDMSETKARLLLGAFMEGDGTQH
jgi:hypothetical protein